MDPQHFQQQYRHSCIKSIARARLLLLGLSSSVIFPGASEAVIDMQTTGWKPAPHRRVHPRGLLLLLEIPILFKILLSLVASSSFRWVTFGATPLQRSSRPIAMMLPLFLVELLEPFLLPAAFMCPSAGFTPGFPLRRPLYCCQTILAVYAAGDSLSLWNELFYCCQLVREISLKAEPESSPGSELFKVEASHRRAK